MLSIITVYRSGGDYDEKYVHNLRRGVAQHTSIEHKFICLSDTVDTEHYDEETGVHWMPLLNDYPRWWSKQEIWRPDLEKLGRILFLDLSCLPVGDLDDILSYDGPACITTDWYYGGPSQSILSFSPGEMREVWDLFNSDPEHWMKEGDKHIAPNFGDQILVNEIYGQDGLKRWQTEYPSQIVSFKEHCKNGVPEGARLVKFHGQPRIHDCEEPWVRAAWSGAFRKTEYIYHANTMIETILDQVKINSERDVKWLKPSEKPPKHVCIVGGGPSLKDDLQGLKLRKRLGHEIWALNGTHDYLIDNGIVPDAHIIMDARPENVKFLKRPHKRVEYRLCSRVHPTLFDAVEGYNVVLWHSYDEGTTEYLQEHHPEKPWATFTGGGTVALRSMVMAQALGFKFIHLYGLDSSYSEGENHAYEQTMNDGEKVDQIFVGNKEFTAARWMARQTTDFQVQYKQLTEAGIKVSVHGRGLLPYVCKLMGETKENSF